jgi:serine protease Do
MESAIVRHRLSPATLSGLVLVPVLLLLAGQPGIAQPMPGAVADPADVVGDLLPTVVTINAFMVEKSATDTTSLASPPAASDHPKPLEGAGVIIDPIGVILTNNHTIAGGSDMQVTFADGTHVSGRILATAPRVDLALVKVDAPHPLTAARWADSDRVRVGEQVFAVGNGLGAGLSVSAGVVSALHRNIQSTPYDDLIQTDAAINHGNSGGPLFDWRGEVIGITTALLSPTAGSAGLGFAIPANDAKFIADRLLRDGRLRQGYIGIKTEQVTQDVAVALGMAQPKGSIVALVRLGEPAEAAGLRAGDVIVRYDNSPVADDRALLRCIARSAIGQAVPVTVLRGGSEQTLQVTPSDWPEPATTLSDEKPHPPALVPRDLGLSLSALTADLRARHGLQMQRGGVLIDDVTPGTDAFDRGLHEGDVILRVQDAEVASPQEVQAAIEAARAANKPFVVALVLSTAEQLSGPHWLALRVVVTQ